MTQPSNDETRAFAARLAAAQKRLAPEDTERLTKAAESENSSAFGMAMRVGSDLIAGIVVGLVVGYGLDRWTGHKPLFMILFTLLGFGAGMRNVWRIVNAPAPGVGAGKNGRRQRGHRVD